MNGEPRWRATVPAHWPTWVRAWAGSGGSLTQHLRATGLKFEVQRLGQGLSRLGRLDGPMGVRAKAERNPKLRHGQRVRQRRVCLQLDGQAVVLANTVVAFCPPREDWPFWQGLGARSLGSMLFTDPQVRRGRVLFACLPARTPWIEAGARALGVRLLPQAPCYARCAQYLRGTGQSPLWVTEIFLPTLQFLKIGTVE